MVPLLHAIKAMVLLIGNYPPDRQQSMHRFAMMMLVGLTAAGVPAELLQPQPFFGRFRYAGGFIAKWLAYIDKFVIFPRRLRSKLKAAPALVHICDHSNAMYARHIRGVPVVATCHDLLAVRGALGEPTDCPASFTGKLLQRWIVSGLEEATVVSCVSHATLEDAGRLVTRRDGKPRLELISLGLNYPYRELPLHEARTIGGTFRPRAGHTVRLARRLELAPEKSRRRPAHFRALQGSMEWIACFRRRTALGRALFVRPAIGRLGSGGRGSSCDERIARSALQLRDRAAFPSTFEGFGWPIAEAHACGCPVICTGREPMTEVAGDAGLTHDVEDEAGFAADLLRLTNPAEREPWRAKALENAKRFSPALMMEKYCELYRSLAPV